jgi:hypothetical protein
MASGLVGVGRGESSAIGRPLDPQDYGLGVFADQSGHSGGVVGVPTCWLSGQMHAVWSPDGPQARTACMPDLVRLIAFDHSPSE